MGFRPIVLTSDWLIFGLLAALSVFALLARRREYWRVAAREVSANRLAMTCFGVLGLYGAIGFLDTLHYQGVDETGKDSGPILSVLDTLCRPLRDRTETTYSAPFATRSFAKETIVRDDGSKVREYPPLKFAGAHLAERDDPWPDIVGRLLTGLLWGLGIGAATIGLALGISRLVARLRQPVGPDGRRAWLRRGLWTGGFFSVAALLVCELVVLSAGYHVLGTDKAGQDVLYLALKGVRTGMIIGTLTTLIVTPFAVAAGTLAGYFGGRVDDAITYVYTTLSSIPEILLIAAAMLIVQAKLADADPVSAGDLRVIALCVIMGITSWTGLCRLIRGEVLKLREMEFVTAAEAFGVDRMKILMRHLVPNVMHIVLISVVLSFSGLVLAEAILAYIGIGVGSSVQSWGNLINQARLELARDPVVWWTLFAAFIFMLGLVLPANLFGDAVRDALDPRLRTR